MVRLLVLASAFALHALPLLSLSAQSFSPRRGADRVLRIPLEAGVRSGDTVRMDVDWRGAGIVVNNRHDWESAGLISWGSWEVRRSDKHDSRSRVVMAHDSSKAIVELLFPADPSVAQMVWQVVTYDEDARELAERVSIAGVLPSAFSREYSSVPDSLRTAQLLAARRVGYTRAFKPDTFQSRTYAPIIVVSANRYNDAKLSANQRAATFIRDELLPAVKRYAPLFDSVAVSGLVVESQVWHSNFVTKSPPAPERWQAYLSLADLKRFADARITSQELVDNSVVLINGDRTKVMLAND